MHLHDIPFILNPQRSFLQNRASKLFYPPNQFNQEFIIHCMMQLQMFLRNISIIALLKVSWSQLSAYSSAEMHSKPETAVTISSCVAFVSFEFSVSIVELHRRTLDVAVKNGGGLLSKHKVLLGKVKKHIDGFTVLLFLIQLITGFLWRLTDVFVTGTCELGTWRHF